MLQAQSGTTSTPIMNENEARSSRRVISKRNADLKSYLRQQLAAHAHSMTPTTYEHLGGTLFPDDDGNMILQDFLEQLMEDDAREGRPLVAAIAVKALSNGLPAAWFFRKAASLGKFAGQPDDVEAFAFHARELHQSISHYRCWSRDQHQSKRDHPCC